MIHQESHDMSASDDPILRSNKRQLLEGLAWGLGISLLTFTMFGHTWRDYRSWFFVVHLAIVTAACTAIYFIVRKSQQRLQRWLRAKRY
jgi:hypothetical protein